MPLPRRSGTWPENNAYDQPAYRAVTSPIRSARPQISGLPILAASRWLGDRVAAIQQFNAGSEAANRARTTGGDWQLAYQLHSSAVMNDDTFGAGWHELGNDLADMQHSAAALAAFRRSIELPDGPNAGDMVPAMRAKSLVQMAYRLYALGHLGEASVTIGRAIAMDSTSPQAWCVSSLIALISGRHEAAVQDALRGLNLDPTNATIETALGLNLLFAGYFRDGLKHFEARFRYKLKHFLTFPYPQWQGEESKVLYIVADQGLGDTLSFARFLRQAASRSKFVYAGVQKELIRLFKASFQGEIESRSARPENDTMLTVRPVRLARIWL